MFKSRARLISSVESCINLMNKCDVLFYTKIFQSFTVNMFNNFTTQCHICNSQTLCTWFNDHVILTLMWLLTTFVLSSLCSSGIPISSQMSFRWHRALFRQDTASAASTSLNTSWKHGHVSRSEGKDRWLESETDLSTVKTKNMDVIKSKNLSDYSLQILWNFKCHSK